MTTVFAHVDENDLYHHDMMGYFGGHMFGIGLFWLIFCILAIVALVLLITWLIKKIQEPSKRKRK